MTIICPFSMMYFRIGTSTIWTISNRFFEGKACKLFDLPHRHLREIVSIFFISKAKLTNFLKAWLPIQTLAPVSEGLIKNLPIWRFLSSNLIFWISPTDSCPSKDWKRFLPNLARLELLKEKESLFPSLFLKGFARSWTIGIKSCAFLYSHFLQNESSSWPHCLIYVSPLYYFSYFLRIDKYDWSLFFLVGSILASFLGLVRWPFSWSNPLSDQLVTAISVRLACDR